MPLSFGVCTGYRNLHYCSLKCRDHLPDYARSYVLLERRTSQMGETAAGMLCLSALLFPLPLTIFLPRDLRNGPAGAFAFGALIFGVAAIAPISLTPSKLGSLQPSLCLFFFFLCGSRITIFSSAGVVCSFFPLSRSKEFSVSSCFVQNWASVTLSDGCYYAVPYFFPTPPHIARFTRCISAGSHPVFPHGTLRYGGSAL